MPDLSLQGRLMHHSPLECLQTIGFHVLLEFLLRPLQVPHLLFLGALRVELAKRLAHVEGARGEHCGHVRVDPNLPCLALVELELAQGLGHV